MRPLRTSPLHPRAFPATVALTDKHPRTHPTREGHRMLLHRLFPSVAVLALLAAPLAAGELPAVTKVELQPLAAQAQRVADALDFLGVPLTEAEKKALQAGATEKDAARAVRAIQEVLDPHCLAGVRITADAVETRPGPARPLLAEQGWQVFLIKV